MLTTSADTGAAFTGTDKGDVFKADSILSADTYYTTLNSSDELDGGAGKDTLNITFDDNSAYEMASATIKNIETITIKGADNVLANVAGSNITGLETISVLKSANAVVHANSTTDVNVSGATGTIDVSGGKNVVVNDSTANKAIVIGENATLTGFTATTTATNATGTITVTDTKNASGTGTNNNITIDGGTDVTVTATGTANGTAVQSGKIIIGGKTEATGDVKVTQNLNSDGKATITGGDITVTGGKTVTVDVNSTNSATAGIADITTGKITVNGDANTTAVTVNQTEAITGSAAVKAVAGVNEVASVKFVDLAVNETVILDGLTFKAAKALKAAEVAAAFANLKAGDTHGQAKADNGIYSGALVNYNTGAVSTDTVVFTATEAKGLADLTIGGASAGTEVITTTTQGVAAVDAVAAVDDVNDNLTLAATNLKTLNLTTTGEESVFGLISANTETLTIAAAADLDIATGSTLTALKTVTITGAGDVDLGDLSTASTSNFATLTASAATGDITATVDGDKATVTTGAGNDSITVKAATEVEKAIDLGAGDDRLDLSTITTVTSTKTAAIAGGAGTDTVVLDANNAVTLSSTDNSTIFKSKVTGFEKLEIAGAATAARDVHVGNLGYNHVILGANGTALTLTDMANNGTVVLTANQAAGAIVKVKDADLAESTTDVLNVALENSNINKSVYKIDLTGATIVDGQTVTVGGVLLATAATADTVAALAGKAVSPITINGIDYTANAVGNVVTLTSVEPVIAPAAILDIGGTLSGITQKSTELSFTAADLDVGTLTVANVEKINISTSDLTTAGVDAITLTLAAADATTINVTGDSDLILLNTGAGNTKVTSIDASTLTGDLTVTSANTTTSATIKGGSGNDTIKAANLDKVFGGAGNDTITAADLAELTGGTGADMFEAKIATTKNSYATIKDFNKAEGDSIKFANATDFNNTKVTLASTIGFEEYLDKAASIANGGDGTAGATETNGVSWFTYTDLETGTNTYLVYNKAADNKFDIADDIVIKVTGVVDFSTAAFNSDTETIAFA